MHNLLFFSFSHSGGPWAHQAPSQNRKKQEKQNLCTRLGISFTLILMKFCFEFVLKTRRYGRVHFVNGPGVVPIRHQYKIQLGGLPPPRPPRVVGRGVRLGRSVRRQAKNFSPRKKFGEKKIRQKMFRRKFVRQKKNRRKVFRPNKFRRNIFRRKKNHRKFVRRILFRRKKVWRFFFAGNVFAEKMFAEMFFAEKQFAEKMFGEKLFAELFATKKIGGSFFAETFFAEKQISLKK